MRYLPLLLALALLPHAQAAEAPPTVPVTRHALSNGLTVLLSPDHRLPVVAVEIRYRVGSGHEADGFHGFAHLFEHLMFQGSAHHNDEYFKPFEPVGGQVNGTTSTDRTNYYVQVPSNYLELALWMESDRMGHLLDVVDQKKLDNQRDVVLNERRQNYEDRPYGMAWPRISESTFPAGHPYHHTAIGSPEDLKAAQLKDVHAFFRAHYVPTNAILTIVGDFEPEATLALVRRYFEPIPGGQPSARPNLPTFTPQASHVVERDEVKLAQVNLAWPSPALFADGDAALDVLASLLAEGKSSRLYQPLVYEKKLAQSIEVAQISYHQAGLFVIEATASPGVSADQLYAALDATLKEALKTPPTADELARVKNGWRKSFFGRIEGVLSRAQLLSSYEHFAGRADYVAEDLARYERLTAEEVQAAALKWLSAPAARVDVIPMPQGGAK